MKVRVLYFASVRDVCNLAEETWEIAPNATVAEFRLQLLARYPALRDRSGSLRLARNEAFAEPAECIEEGDTLAVIPPVSGG
jgi:sulfur-carrier protein